MEEVNKLIHFVKEGDDEQAVELAKNMVSRIDPNEIINGLTKGMRELGDQFEKKEIFLPELLIASDALMLVMDVVKPYITTDTKNTKKIIIGTVKGDVHEIGKNIASIVFKAEGLNVIDLGVDVSPQKFIDKAEEMNADFIGLSTLMSTTMIKQKEVIELLIEQNKRRKYKVLIGGAPTSQKWADNIGADA